MQKRALGKTGINVSALGLGCMGMSEFYGPADDATSLAVIHRALDLGVDFFDTADMYGSGKNEELVGRALRGKQARIATKFAIMRDGAAFVGISGKPEYVQKACEASLRRLGVEAIDLYYQHRVDPQTPIEDTVGAMSRLVEQGKVRWLGLSEASAATIRRAHKVHPITALQSEYSLWTRDPEGEILDACAELGITFVAYSPLGRGFLTGSFATAGDVPQGDFRSTNPRFTGDNFAKNRAMVERFSEFAAKRGVTPGQLALAWLLARSPRIIPIPGTKKLARLEENVGAAAIELTADDLRAIDEIAPKGSTAGTRYPESNMKLVNA